MSPDKPALSENRFYKEYLSVFRKESYSESLPAVTPYKKVEENYPKYEIRRILSENFQDYCKEMEKKGVEIIQNDVKIYTGSETYYAKGTLKIRRSIGREVPSVPLPSKDAPEEETKNGD